ncbi:MAG: glycosyltransferase family 2 protein [Deltaproteobacteria bacterium]|nr:glycosyltransferase family 2 protein [Deltaproteobacteria bacterium]
MAQVSVIIPTWNRAGWVTEAVSSVLAQTFRDFELLVVDDGSDDDTLEALAPFYRRLKLLRRSRRRGVSAARNLGIAVARGQWLAFLDSDDLWLPDKLARQVAFLEEHPHLLICQTEELWIRNGRRVNPPATHRKVGGHIFLPSLQRCMVSPSAVMLHRRLLEEVGTFDEALPAAEDYDFWLRLTWRYPVGLLPGTLVVKRGGHPDQLSRQWGLDRWRIRALVKILEEPELPELYRQAAARTLAEKCTIYVRGCEKRGKFEEAAAYRRLLENEFKGLGEWVWEKGQGLKPLAPSPNEYLPQPDANGQRRAYGHL